MSDQLPVSKCPTCGYEMDARKADKAMSEKEQRELDAWIAKHVMDAKKFVGVKKRGLWYRPNAHGYTDRENEAWHLTREEAKKQEYPRGDEPVTICEFGMPLYTTDPTAAMQVLEKCAQMLHGEDREETVSIGYDTPRYVVEKTNCNQNLRMEAVSLPLAICLFAKDLFSK